MWLDYTHGVDDVKTPRDRRSRQAAATRLRILEAAGKLFAERGYGGTTIEAVATEADVAVETVYARFKNKRNLLAAYLDMTIVGDAEPVPLLEREELRKVREATDQREQLRLLARLGRNLLERAAPAHAVLRGGASVDPEVMALAEEDDRRRRTTQRAFVEIIAARGPLREGLSINDAADTVGALASPDTFALLTQRRGWSPARYERWLATNLALTLLPSPSSATS
jgi:AcrR family transcriptional regulator